MFDFNLFCNTYHSIFYNMSCIIIMDCYHIHNDYNFFIYNNYNILNYITSVLLIYDFFFLLDKYYWFNQNLTLIYLYYTYEALMYSCYLWRYNSLIFINELKNNNLISSFILLYKYNNNWDFTYNNFAIKYNIISRVLPVVPNIFHITNIFMDKNIFPYKSYGELYFYYQYYHYSFFFNNYLPKTHFIFEYFFGYKLINSGEFDYIGYFHLNPLRKAGIYNYLIGCNNYLLPRLIPINWYNWGFCYKEYLYYSLPIYWDYDYITNVLKYFNYFNYTNVNIYHDSLLANNNINNILYQNYDINLTYHFLINRILDYYKTSIIINIVCMVLLYVYINMIYNTMKKGSSYIINFVNWYINILIFCLSLKIQFYLFFYFFNPLYLYFGKSLREIMSFYSNFIVKKNLNLFKNKEECDLNSIYNYNIIESSYIKYITFLLFSMFFRYIYIFINIVLYNIIYYIKLYLFINYYVYLGFNLINYLKIYIIKHNKFILSYIQLEKLWIKYHYIYLEFFNFFHQNKLPSNNFFLEIWNWLRKNEISYYNYNLILNKTEYYNTNRWRDIWEFNKNIIYFKNKYLKKLYIFNYIIYIIKYIFYLFKINIIKFNFFFFKVSSKYQISYSKSIILNKLIYYNLINIMLNKLGLGVFLFFDLVQYILIYITKLIINILYKFRIIYILSLILILYYFNFNLQIFLLPFEYFCLYELPWISQIIFWIYNQNYIFFFEWINDNNLIYQTFKIKLEFFKTQEDIWNDIFVHFNFQKKKWKDVTNEKLWNMLNPIYLIIFLFYEVQIQWFIYQFWNYFITSILMVLYLKYIPFLYWYNLNYFSFYMFNYIFKYFNYYFYLIKCYYAFIYIYLIPLIISKRLSLLYYYNIVNLIFYINYLYYKINIIISFSSLIMDLIFNTLINIIIFNIYIYKLINIKYILILINLYFIEVLSYYFHKVITYQSIYLNYLNIYIFINIYYKIQSNIDIIFSYFRINKFKLYKWNKFSKKKKAYRYYINSFLIEYFYSPTYEDNLISLTSLTRDSSLIREQTLKYFINPNSLIKYWYWSLFNYFDKAIIEFSHWEEDDDDTYFGYKYYEHSYDVIMTYDKFWYLSQIHFNLYKLFYLSRYYIDIFEYFIKSNSNMNKIQFKVIIGYIGFYYVYFFFFFKIWFLIYKKKNLSYNTEYLWDKFRISEKKKNFKNIDNKINNWLLVIQLKKKLNYKNDYNSLINYNSNILINKINNGKINKLSLINTKIYLKIKKLSKLNSIYLNKLWINYLNKNYFRINNTFINFLSLKIYQNYQNIYKINSDILYLLVSYLYKKNKYAFFINKQELNKIIIPFYKKYYLFNKSDILIQNNVMLNTLSYFKNIEHYFLNNNFANWILNKNNTTIFYNFNLNNKKEILELTLDFPYEFYYFIFIIVYVYIYYKIILFSIIWNQKYWIGPNIFEKREWFNYVINLVQWNLSIKLLNIWDNINSSLLNTNAASGIFGQQLINIYVSTNKYNYLQYNWSYKKNFYLYYNTSYFNIKEIYSNFIMLNFIKYQKIFIIINIFWYFIQIGIKKIYKKFIFKYLNINFILENKINIQIFNLKKIKYILIHYKFKKMLWNNFLKK